METETAGAGSVKTQRKKPDAKTNKATERIEKRLQS